ncbi:MAG: cyanophycinase [Desulfosudis oleivorans]|nr:cyanophycinase [Desulfosudis oleivorans]
MNAESVRSAAERASVFLLIAALSLSSCGNPAGPQPPGPDDGQGYRYYSVGNSGDLSTAYSPGLVLMGGGTDVDAAFSWLIQKAEGDFVVIRASGSDAYNSYIYSLGQIDSVETLVVDKRSGADAPFVADKIRKADALFIAGGNQADYIRIWNGTALQEALEDSIRRGVPLGGTSAGLAVLGEFVYSAFRGTVYSNEALADPYDHRVTLARDFLSVPLLSGVITDSHFVSSDRMGRLVVFLARIVKDGWAPQAKGIGVDERTALLVEPDGTASLSGSGAAYFILADRVPETCVSGTPLAFARLQVHKIRAGGLSTSGNGRASRRPIRYPRPRER